MVVEYKKTVKTPDGETVTVTVNLDAEDLSFAENMAVTRRNIEDTRRILKESEPNARVIEEWLNRRRQIQE